MRLIKLTAFIGMLSISGGFVAASEMEGYGQIISVTEKTEQVNEPREECNTQAVETPKQRGMAGGIIGGVLGGVAGHQIGSGRGNTAATIAGALGGAVAGDQIQNRNRGNDTKEVQNCKSVDNYHSRVSGYLVKYKFKGNTYTDEVPTRPQGDRIRVRQQITPIL